MGKNKVAQCKICSKEMRSDHLKRHLSQHRNMSTYPTKKCSICSKVMIGWNLKRHMKTHSKTLKDISENVRVDQREYVEKQEIGAVVKQLLDQEDIDPKSLSKNNLKALEAHSMQCNMWNMAELNTWQRQLLQLMKPSEREIIWVRGETGGEGKTWFQNYIEHHYGSKRVHPSIKIQSQYFTHFLKEL